MLLTIENGQVDGIYDLMHQYDSLPLNILPRDLEHTYRHIVIFYSRHRHIVMYNFVELSKREMGRVGERPKVDMGLRIAMDVGSTFNLHF